ncbi:cytochrome c oxidase copper chaperone [Stylonychia lemnae]|uniref:Cytochrome c oxidase copper chaperone n=1 Tax=Stylonychia lemnae TaxID=5949 RepID=A0A078AZZ9_STYLE|nr:cytochrome c oxidase copper chaperone [Stylonychia lemnae]|eukprot:CDW87824.1 cytochrome c oxidase copper chaperone [Stylonychia lemnae]
MESVQAVVQPSPRPTGHKCQGVCCACRQIRVMKDNCLKNNAEDECQSFIQAFQTCVDEKRQEIAARKALELLQAAQ